MGLFTWLFIRKIKQLERNKDIEGLVKELQYRKDADVREAAAIALGDLKDRRAVEPLIAALMDPGWHKRWSAASALGKIGDRRGVEPLITALRDPYCDGRVFAVWALRDLGDPRAVEPLIAALGDQYWKVREEAAETLLRIDDPRAEPYREMCEQILESGRGRTFIG